MATPRPSQEIVERVDRVLKVARERNTVRAAALHDAGLLLFPTLQAAIIAQAIDDIADLIDQASVRDLTPRLVRMPTTPLDTKRVVVSWLRDQATRLQEQAK